MFASKSLADRNNDPEPYFLAFEPTVRLNEDDAHWETRAIDYGERPEFQHGHLPENRILTELRRDGIQSWSGWRVDKELERMINGDYFHLWSDFTEAELSHATRVLTFLSAVTR